MKRSDSSWVKLRNLMLTVSPRKYLSVFIEKIYLEFRFWHTVSRRPLQKFNYSTSASGQHENIWRIHRRCWQEFTRNDSKRFKFFKLMLLHFARSEKKSLKKKRNFTKLLNPWRVPQHEFLAEKTLTLTLKPLGNESFWHYIPPRMYIRLSVKSNSFFQAGSMGRREETHFHSQLECKPVSRRSYAPAIG